MWISLRHIFIILTALFLLVNALPTPQSYEHFTPIYSVDRIDAHNYYIPNYLHAAYDDYHLNHLRRGYYYIDEGIITAVPASLVPGVAATRPAASANRRQDQAGSFNPVTVEKPKKHKKLFVPNLYG